MKLVLLFLFFLPQTGCTSTKNTSVDTAKTVYLCGSGKGKRYHLNPKCRGLRICHYKTVKTTLEKALNEGKTLCNWED